MRPTHSELLTPLEEFTQLHWATVRRFGRRAVDLAFPNPQFLADPRPYEVLASLAAQAGPLDLRYSPFGGFTPVRRRLAGALAKQHALPYTWSDIIMTPGATAALRVALHTLFAPGDHIILISPCWMDYPLYLTDLGLSYTLVPSTHDKHLDPDAIAQAWTPSTRGVIISQPASPTGVIHDHTELQHLAAVLERHAPARPPLLIADEAHAHQVWDNTPCPAPAAYYAHTLTVRSFGKAWEMQGQRTGCLAVSPRLEPRSETTAALLRQMRIGGHCAPTALTQQLAAALCETAPDLKGLADLQRHARQQLHAAGITVLDTHATRFLYARCPVSDDLAFVSQLAGRGVLVMPSSLFHERGWFRIALNLGAPHLDRALATIGEEYAHA
ncbi:aminotransferase class I/II-fold pyridoxal phosphate-dependent enzyme [Streptomyces sp. SAI-090]|jgi:aspartate aminotransferase|uniref:aminotransferase class I/II-fold pyridoxal phosphate-dependent enzyme n=1 Tax=Streptomyces sp. SAI-090 TaxID=2940545 RepID=UPI002476DB64|nr:aminotransferase class I/II-fold pyridoxal phosphate-dependent enzyme [Streptomyces sp. SAI-090]MDH6522334.1 aspartate aminotransferase [Streptomyces sp. SAI-090]